MTGIPAAQARQQWGETLDAAKSGPVTITEHGRETVMIVEIGTGRRMLAASNEAALGGRFRRFEDVVRVLGRPTGDATWAAEIDAARDETVLRDPWSGQR